MHISSIYSFDINVPITTQFTITILVALLCVTSYAEAKPTFLVKKFLLARHVLPRYLPTNWKLPSLYLPNPLNLWSASAIHDVKKAPTVIYHQHHEPEVVEHAHPAPIVEDHDLHPVYIAETPAVKHIAPLPEGYTHSVHALNVQPALGTL